MIIKDDKTGQRSLVILTAQLHLPFYKDMLINVFDIEYPHLNSEEYIQVLVKCIDGNNELHRKNDERWDPASFKGAIEIIFEKVAQEQKNGDNSYTEIEQQELDNAPKLDGEETKI